MFRKWLKGRLSVFVFTTVFLCAIPGWGAEFSASFKDTDIQEFINTVSKNLHKTVKAHKIIQDRYEILSR